MQKTTIRDIADKAGVCIATVSRVINNKSNVLPETRQRVLDLIERTGYRPNAMGRGLVLRRSGNILLEVFNVADPYCVALADNISNLCQANGSRMLLADCKLDPVLEAEHLSRAQDGSIDGMIISPLPVRMNIPLFRKLVRSGFPIVVMDNVVPTVKMNCVKYDDRAASRLATDYLLDKGHRRIAFIQRRHTFHTVVDRHECFVECHKKRGLTLDPKLVVTLPYDFTMWDRGCFERLLELPKPPTAFLTENEIVAVACMNNLLQHRIRIPDDIAVMAIGDTMLGPLMPVPMTTVSLHPEAAAKKAVELLNDLILNGGTADTSPRTYVQKPSLVIRESA